MLARIFSREALIVFSDAAFLDRIASSLNAEAVLRHGQTLDEHLQRTP
jgi:hypothetical protein